MFDWLFKNKEIDEHCKKVELEYNNYMDLIRKEEILDKKLTKKQQNKIFKSGLLVSLTPFPSRESWILFKIKKAKELFGIGED
ncbi:MAG: hypothetical protein AABY22_05480 [Nanoarchaeota archaeon]